MTARALTEQEPRQRWKCCRILQPTAVNCAWKTKLG